MPALGGTTLITGSLNIPVGSIGDTHCSAVSPLGPTKVQHQWASDHELFGTGTTVVALAKVVHVGHGALGTVIDVSAAITGTIATGSDRTISIDLQKSTGGGAFATVLSSPIAFTHSSVLRTAAAATISGGSYVAGDLFQLVVSVAGVASAQALGLVVSVTFTETPT